MKKKLTLQTFKAAGWSLVLLLLIALLGSCADPNCMKGEGEVETRVLQLDPFDALQANGDFKVKITQGFPQKVEVKGEPNILNQLTTDVEDGKWWLGFRSCVRRSKTVEVLITVPEVQSLVMNGSGSIVATNTVETDELHLEVNGSGRISMGVEAEKLISRISGSGEIALGGSSPLSTLTISGSGKYNGFDLQAENVTVNLSGSGKAEVAASNSLTVSLSGSGQVVYIGNPSLSSQVSGSGKVTKK